MNKHFIPVIIWAVLIMIVSSIPNLGLPPINFTYIDKVEHFIEYGILGFLLAMGMAKSRPGPVFLTALLICGSYGIIDELHQLFIPGRFCDLFDMLADILGSAAGAAILNWLKSRFICLSLRQASPGSAK